MFKFVNSRNTSNDVMLGSVASVFIIFSLISFATSYFYSQNKPFSLKRDVVMYEGKEYIKLSVLNIYEKQEVYQISIVADLALGAWASINGQVFDQQNKYIFSFGQDVSNYPDMNDDDDPQNIFSVTTTFSQQGQYYFLIGAANNFDLQKIDVSIFKKRGSPVPHFILGCFLFIMGILIREIKSRFVETKKRNV